jgi:hypothetical protein
MVSLSSAQACHLGRQARFITRSLYSIVYRVEHNCIQNRDALRAADLINEMKVLYDELCDDCKRFAADNALPHIQRILNYFGLD